MVIARVEKISQSRGAECAVVSLAATAEEPSPRPLGSALRGTVRGGDMAAPGMQQEFSDVGKCFRPGDVIRAKVISLGDAKGYFLSTVADMCGVLCGDFAQSRPLSYNLIAKTDGTVEHRKVAQSAA